MNLPRLTTLPGTRKTAPEAWSGGGGGTRSEPTPGPDGPQCDTFPPGPTLLFLQPPVDRGGSCSIRAETRAATLQAYQRRMGWSIKWVSSLHTDFDRDSHVTFMSEELEARQAYHNYALTSFPVREAAGVSVFYKDADGAIYHTYSCCSRGLDILSYSMEWLRHHDRYEDRSLISGGALAPMPWRPS
ncbi:MAG TPA: DUF899 family protein [Candidatus Binatia bacterium]|nr:DUF899 family protein [Candidatus Binatia bacterium]